MTSNTDFVKYRNGSSGLIRWAEDNVWVPIIPIGDFFAKWWPIGDLPDTRHPETGQSYKDLWKCACDVFHECIIMENGQFKYRLKCFCEPRGEGKSFKAVLIQMWKFFNWAKQQIMLCANSKDQSKFVHFNEITSIIRNSTNLIKIVGRKNIQEKEVRLKDARGNVVSCIRFISSFSGIVSSITGYTVDGKLGNQKEIIEVLNRRIKIVDSYAEIEKKGIRIDRCHELREINHRLIPVNKYYSLSSGGTDIQMAPLHGLDSMSDFYDTDWAIMAGLDRADAAKVREGGARTILTVIAKGLPGSRSNPNAWKIAVPEYVYILLCLANIGDHSLDNLKKVLVACHEEYDGIDKICSERWGAWDLAAWAEETLACEVELVVASYDRQLSGFTTMYTLVTEGRFKSPVISVMGAKGDDIMVEEMTMFDHDAYRKWFGSPEKKKKYGVQDDSIFSINWTI